MISGAAGLSKKVTMLVEGWKLEEGRQEPRGAQRQLQTPIPGRWIADVWPRAAAANVKQKTHLLFVSLLNHFYFCVHKVVCLCGPTGAVIVTHPRTTHLKSPPNTTTAVRVTGHNSAHWFLSQQRDGTHTYVLLGLKNSIISFTVQYFLTVSNPN